MLNRKMGYNLQMLNCTNGYVIDIRPGIKNITVTCLDKRR